MYANRQAVTVTSDASGDATAYTANAVTGAVLSIQYVKTDYADTVDFAITSETTGQGLWTEANVTASAIRAPRQPLHSQVGAALGATIVEPVYLAGERVKIIISNAGNAKTGTFYVTTG